MNAWAIRMNLRLSRGLGLPRWRSPQHGGGHASHKMYKVRHALDVSHGMSHNAIRTTSKTKGLCDDER